MALLVAAPWLALVLFATSQPFLLCDGCGRRRREGGGEIYLSCAVTLLALPPIAAEDVRVGIGKYQLGLLAS